MLIRNKNIKLILNYTVGPLVFSILLYSICRQLIEHAESSSSFEQIMSRLEISSVLYLIAVLAMMMINWGIEARKWQLSLRPLARISFSHSFRAVFSGTALGFFTPNSIGEYIGRMVHLDEGRRIASVPVTFVCSIAQLLVTLTTGCCGWALLRDNIGKHYAGHIHIMFLINAFGLISVVVLIFLTIFYFRLSLLCKWACRLRYLSRWKDDMMILKAFNATLLLQILSLSFVRFLVFVAQYYLLFRVFEVQIEWWQAFWSLSLVFLIVALVPGLGMLTELGVRWQSGIQLLQIFSPDIGGIFAASMLIWIVNMVIPAIVGASLIWRLKLFLNRTKLSADTKN